MVSPSEREFKVINHRYSAVDSIKTPSDELMEKPNIEYSKCPVCVCGWSDKTSHPEICWSFHARTCCACVAWMGKWWNSAVGRETLGLWQFAGGGGGRSFWSLHFCQCARCEANARRLYASLMTLGKMLVVRHFGGQQRQHQQACCIKQMAQ